MLKKSTLSLIWILATALALASDFFFGSIIPFQALLLTPVVLATRISGRFWGLVLALVLPIAHGAILFHNQALPFTPIHLMLALIAHFLTLALIVELIHRLLAQNKIMRLRWDRILESLPVGVWVSDRDGRIINGNRVNREIWEWGASDAEQGYAQGQGLLRAWDIRTGERIGRDTCPLTLAWRDGISTFHKEMRIESCEGRMKVLSASGAPILDESGRILGGLLISRDITANKRLETEKERLIESLQEAAKNIRILRGMLPICANCKSIRDDKGYWKRIEDYIQKHSEVEFSHGVCPDCIEKLYPEYVNRVAHHS